MKSASILIVESEALIGDSIRRDLYELGYQVPVPPCSTYKQAVAAINRQRPDLVLIDTCLKGNGTGTDLAAYIKKNCGIPFIFLSSYLSPIVFEEVNKVKPAGFLTKPYLLQNLWANIELALCGSNQPKDSARLTLIRHSRRETISVSELLYLEAEGSYTRYHFGQKNILQRKNLKQAMEEIPEGLLIQTHRSFAINLQKVTAFSNRKLFIGEFEIPISRSRHNEVFELWKRNKLD